MPPKLITSPSNPIIKDIKSLDQRKRRKETGLFLVEGLRSVIEGMELGANLKYIAYHTDSKEKEDIKRCVSYCNKCEGLALEVNDLVLEKISRKDNPQSVIGVFEQKFHKLTNIIPTPPIPSPLTGEGLSGEAQRAKTGQDGGDKGSCYVVLEQVRDPGNLGTIIRTIDAVGADGVILIDQCCDPYSVECIRATMGSTFSVPIFTATLDEFKSWAKGWMGDIIGTTLQSSVDFREVTPKKPLLLMMGNEQAGLSEDLRGIATTCIRLPMNGRADSLNLSVATGICLYALLEPWK